MTTAAFTRHEARTAFRRREAERTLAQSEAAALFQFLDEDIARGEIQMIAESAAVEAAFAEVLEACFSHQPPVFIRTVDGWHLASARVARETEFVTADARQRTAALLLGFTVLPP